MRKRQIQIRFGQEELERLWESIPDVSQKEISRLYARLLLKAGKMERT